MTRLLSPLQSLFQLESVGQNALQSSLKRLPRVVQQVFLLNRLDELSHATIAERLDLPLYSVQRHLLMALESGFPDTHRLDITLMTANHWYIKLQSPLTTASERIDFRRWLDAAPANLDAFHAAELRWRTLLAPARALGADAWYRQPRAHLNLRNCGLAMLGLLLPLLAVCHWA